MKIFKQFKNESGRTEISLEEAKKRLEDAGYWKPGTVDKMLSEPPFTDSKSVSLWTPWATFYFEP